MKTFSITDAGAIREMNQDFYFSSDTAVGNLPNLFIVADGMGGHKAGDYASRYTIERVVASVSRNADEPYPSSKRLSTRQMSFWWLSLVRMKLSVEWVPP